MTVRIASFEPRNDDSIGLIRNGEGHGVKYIAVSIAGEADQLVHPIPVEASKNQDCRAELLQLLCKLNIDVLLLREWDIPLVPTGVVKAFSNSPAYLPLRTELDGLDSTTVQWLLSPNPNRQVLIVPAMNTTPHGSKE